ncbi:hypothetical protein HU675_0034625 [Bradyrhizobium septentrionale]|uniref:hypothetical protein n=1 Tax=Bradyrhizobium septentrionale TaxID=1404411 RepID=UPI001596FD3A|nr:hypothetical protein [Bradyrhizobium septentrionale]UGY23057.1 hypothetical protein HU675_0034625 [Bradyrhizobium septentrionale]
MNPIVRENLVRELEHLVQHRPPGGTLFMMVRETPDMLVATLQEGVISLAYPHTGVFDFFRSNRFAAFCRRRGFVVQKEQWHNVRVSYALIGTVAAHAAQTIDECFSSVFAYRVHLDWN